MPKLEITADYNGGTSMSLMPADGDIRENNGQLEKFLFGSWTPFGPSDISAMRFDINNLITTVGDIEQERNAIRAENDNQARTKAHALLLETAYPDLGEAGDQLRKMKETVAAFNVAYDKMAADCAGQSKVMNALVNSEQMMGQETDK